MAARTAGDVCSRFISEQENIQRFLDFLWEKSTMYDEDEGAETGTGSRNRDAARIKN